MEFLHLGCSVVEFEIKGVPKWGPMCHNPEISLFSSHFSDQSVMLVYLIVSGIEWNEVESNGVEEGYHSIVWIFYYGIG